MVAASKLVSSADRLLLHHIHVLALNWDGTAHALLRRQLHARILMHICNVQVFPLAAVTEFCHPVGVAAAAPHVLGPSASDHSFRLTAWGLM